MACQTQICPGSLLTSPITFSPQIANISQPFSSLEYTFFITLDCHHSIHQLSITILYLSLLTIYNFRTICFVNPSCIGWNLLSFVDGFILNDGMFLLFVIAIKKVICSSFVKTWIFTRIEMGRTLEGVAILLVTCCGFVKEVEMIEALLCFS